MMDEKSNFIITDTEEEVLSNTRQDQSWFWTDEWQAGEKEAEEDLKNGRITKEMNSKEFDLFLKSLMK